MDFCNKNHKRCQKESSVQKNGSIRREQSLTCSRPRAFYFLLFYLFRELCKTKLIVVLNSKQETSTSIRFLLQIVYTFIINIFHQGSFE